MSSTASSPIAPQRSTWPEFERLDFAEAYLVARAEATGVGRVASFDRGIDRITTVARLEP